MKRKILTSLFAAAAVSFSASAMANPTISNLDGSLVPFGGFDWASNGTGISKPVTAALNVGDTFTTYYFATAEAIKQAGGGTFSGLNMVTGGPGTTFADGQYEYTAVFQVQERVNAVFNAPNGSTTAFFEALGGTWNIYYDGAFAGGGAVANQITGTGFTDGILVLSGTITPGDVGSFTAASGGQSGTGNFNFKGEVTNTNETYIQPDMASSNGFSTLQLGGNITTDWTAPTGTPWGAGLLTDSLVFQADGNQTFVPETTDIPEPGILALLGLGMFGLFATTRRRNNQLV